MVFILFFINVNTTILLLRHFDAVLIIGLMLVMMAIAYFIIKKRQLKTLLLLQEKVDKKENDHILINRTSSIFMAFFIGIPGFFTAILGLFLFLPRWRKFVTLWLLKLLHL